MEEVPLTVNEDSKALSVQFPEFAMRDATNVRK